MARPISIIELTQEEQRELQRRVNAPTVSRRDNLRAKIVLCRAEGMKQIQVGEELRVSVACVNKWSQRFEQRGLAGLEDQEGRGRRPSIPLDKVEQVITRATEKKGRGPDGHAQVERTEKKEIDEAEACPM